jgi:hypothetical protein
MVSVHVHSAFSEDGVGRPTPSLPLLPAVQSYSVNILSRASQPFQETLVTYRMAQLKQMVPQIHFFIVKSDFPKQGNPGFDVYMILHLPTPFIF